MRFCFLSKEKSATNCTNFSNYWNVPEGGKTKNLYNSCNSVQKTFWFWLVQVRDWRLDIKTSYDEVPYPSFSYAESHPDRLATLATLFGMQPAAVTQCRVLELGCAGGGNLVPMAYGLPESEFVGVDLSARQIAQGEAMVEALRLKNVTLKAMDLMDVGPEFGQFDYIIAHGVYSWTPPAVRDKILEICQRNLAPNGVSYVSYNTYPGWHMIGMIRQMMLYHVRNVSEPEEQAREARAFLDFLAEAVPETKAAYGSYLKMYARFLRGELDAERIPPKSDALLLHDELSEVNDPVYFHQFIEHAEGYGLQYLAEAEFRALPAGENAAQVSAAIGKMAQNIIEAEQYLDFWQHRTFRQTLLCRRGITLNRTLKPEALNAFYLAGRAKPVSDKPDIYSDKVEQFRSPPNRAEDGVIFSTGHPLVKAALVQLDEIWPQAMTLEALLAAARARLGGEATPATLEIGSIFKIEPNSVISKAQAEDPVRVLSASLLACFARGLVSLHVYRPHFSPEVSERPVVSPVARFLTQERNTRITNLWHERVDLDEFDRYLIRRLDGRHDYEALLAAFLSGPVAEGVLALKGTPRRGVKDQDQSPEHPPSGGTAHLPAGGTAQIKQVLAEEMSVHLRWLARASLLIS